MTESIRYYGHIGDEADVVCLIEYEVSGEDKPQTMADPAGDFATLDILSIVEAESGGDLYDIMMAEKKEAGSIEQACWDGATEKYIAEESMSQDAQYDAWKDSKMEGRL